MKLLLMKLLLKIMLFIAISFNLIGFSMTLLHSTGCTITNYSNIINKPTRNAFDVIFNKPFALISYPGIYLGYRITRPWSCE